MFKICEVCMKAIYIYTVNEIQRSNDGMSLDEGPLKVLKNGL